MPFVIAPHHHDSPRPLGPPKSLLPLPESTNRCAHPIVAREEVGHSPLGAANQRRANAFCPAHSQQPDLNLHPPQSPSVRASPRRYSSYTRSSGSASVLV